jgi:hypothetical protein
MDIPTIDTPHFLLKEHIMTASKTTKQKQQLQERFDNYYLLTKQHKTNPVSLYLDSLAPSGRRSVKSALTSSSAVLGFEGPLEAMPWSLVEYQTPRPLGF